MEKQIVMIGAGGIGGITAAKIAKAGYQIEVVDCMPGLAERIETTGIQVVEDGKRTDQRIKVWSSLDQLKSKKDIILIATKVNALESVSDEIESLMKDDSVIVSLQNGMCEEYLADRFGSHRVIGCVVCWGATVHQPGVLEKTSEGGFTIGSLGGINANHYQLVKEILNTTVPVIETDNIYGYLFSKLIINSCITTLGAISGLTLGKMLAKRKIRNIFIDVICESVKVANAKGITIEKYAGKINFYDFANKNDFFAQFKKHMIIKMVGLKYRKLKSSSLQSLETGRKTEIDYLNGYIVRKASELNLEVPLNNKLISLVKEIESGVRKISLENFDLLFFNQYSY